MTVHLVYGSPYTTIKFGNLTPVIIGQAGIASVNGSSEKTHEGTRFVIDISNGNRYIVYALNGPLSLSLDGNVLAASAPYQGVLRVAIAPTASHDTLLDAHVQPYPIAGVVQTEFAGDVGRIHFHWLVEGEGDRSNVLMLALPHHVDSFQDKGGLQPDGPAWRTLKGDMVPFVGGTWTLAEALTTINFFSPRPIPADKLEAIQAAVKEDTEEVVVPHDTYSFGKVAARYGRLVLIAEEVGDTASRDLFVTRMKDLMEPWLAGTNENQLLYDQTWGGVISFLGWNDSGAEYGQGWYNDQHFHWGYFIYSAAVIAKYDPAWAATHGKTIDTLVRAIASPSPDDPHFVASRYKDWFVGHSWASGLFEFGDAKNQESTSESVNGYYGIYLWGLATNNAHLKDWGRLLLATEIRSTQKYWQIMPGDDAIYLPPFNEHSCVGIVWCTKADYATWFGINVEFIHEIQKLPFTPISEELLPAKWIEVEYPHVKEGITRPDPPILEGWKGFIYMSHSIIEREAAWAEAQSLQSYDNGNSKSNTLHWIATRP